LLGAIACSSERQQFQASGSYILKEDEQIYRFQIRVVDLETGLDDVLTLEVPFTGSFTMPETGTSSGPEWTHAYAPHLLRIAELQIENGLLRIILEQSNSKETTAVEFDVSTLDGKVKKSVSNGSKKGS